jgi:hypothetical protein
VAGFFIALSGQFIAMTALFIWFVILYQTVIQEETCGMYEDMPPIPESPSWMTNIYQKPNRSRPRE